MFACFYIANDNRPRPIDHCFELPDTRIFQSQGERAFIAELEDSVERHR
ncbi:MAG: hypothetical protein ACI9PY_003870 [Ascidiaceihabitans sp.]|jgi:hypothetical protein